MVQWTSSYICFALYDYLVAALLYTSDSYTLAENLNAWDPPRLVRLFKLEHLAQAVNMSVRDKLRWLIDALEAKYASLPDGAQSLCETFGEPYRR